MALLLRGPRSTCSNTPHTPPVPPFLSAPPLARVVAGQDKEHVIKFTVTDKPANTWCAACRGHTAQVVSLPKLSLSSSLCSAL